MKYNKKTKRTEHLNIKLSKSVYEKFLSILCDKSKTDKIEELIEHEYSLIENFLSKREDVI
jgi:hypothetical protein